MTLPYLLLVLVIAKISASTAQSSIDIQLRVASVLNNPWNRDYELTEKLLNDRSFAVVVFLYNSSDHLAGLSVHVVGPRKDINCFAPLTLATDSWRTRFSRSLVRHVSRDNVLLTIIDERHDERLLLLNVADCKYDYVYDASLPRTRFIFNSEDSKDARFAIIVHGKEFCRDADWCRLFFDPMYDRTELLNFDFTWTQLVDIEPTTTYDGYVFAVRLTDDDGTHRLRLYDASMGKYKELLVLEGDEETASDMRLRTIVKSSMYCWSPNRMSKFDTIHCSMFRDDGTVTRNRTIVYANDRILEDVKPIPTGFLVLSSRSGCHFTDDCEEMVVSLVENEEMRVEHRRYELECGFFHTRALTIRVDDADGSVEIGYLCTYLDHVGYHSFTVV